MCEEVDYQGNKSLLRCSDLNDSLIIYCFKFQISKNILLDNLIALCPKTDSGLSTLFVPLFVYFAQKPTLQLWCILALWRGNARVQITKACENSLLMKTQGYLEKQRCCHLCLRMGWMTEECSLLQHHLKNLMHWWTRLLTALHFSVCFPGRPEKPCGSSVPFRSPTLSSMWWSLQSA